MASSESRRDARRIQSNVEKLVAWAGRREPMSATNLTTIKEQLSTDLERFASRSEILEQTPVLLSVEHNTITGTRTVTVDMRDGTTRSFETLVDYLETPPVDYRIADAQAAVEESRVFIDEAQAREREALQRADEAVAESVDLRNRLSEAKTVIDQALPVITAYLERREKEEAEV